MAKRMKKLTPDNEVRLDPRNLKGLAHPLRLRLLGALREGGPATASRLASILGESSGATSYHLRQLETFGFIEEAAGMGSGRERWWRAVHASSAFDEGSMRSDPEAALLGIEYLRAIAASQTDRLLGWIDTLPSAPEEWARSGDLSDWDLRLRPEEAAELVERIHALVAEYRRFDPDEPTVEGAAFVAVQLHVLPKFPEERR
jgi:Predicted transcriptional regulator